MSDIRTWLAGIGLGRYADAFEANDMEMDLLKEVDDQTLKEIGMASAGHRLRLRNAIAKLTPTSDVEPNVSGAVAALEVGAGSAERRQLTVMFCDLVGSCPCRELRPRILMVETPTVRLATPAPPVALPPRPFRPRADLPAAMSACIPSISWSVRPLTIRDPRRGLM
jgi:SAM domain (Sterile alpha motif)